jgi:predicted ArsR family transcriptional regulator
MDSDEQTKATETIGSLNEISVLKRREIEARILGPVLDALSKKFGREAVIEAARDAIVTIARQHGRELQHLGDGNSLNDFVQLLPMWEKDGGIELKIREQSDDSLSFDVVRCRFADMYRELGIPELGALLSCNRDYALIEGFNPDVELTRTQTIMEGASYCDFRFRAKSGEKRR